MHESLSLDTVLVSLSRIAWLLVPFLLIILLVILIVFVKKLVGTMKNVDDLLVESEKAIDSAKRQIDALDGPLKTVGSISETVDMVHEASKQAVRSTVAVVIDNISNIRERFTKSKSDEVVATMSDNNEKGTGEENE